MSPIVFFYSLLFSVDSAQWEMMQSNEQYFTQDKTKNNSLYTHFYKSFII